MGRLHGSKTFKIYNFKCVIFNNDDKEEINEIKLFSTFNEMEDYFNVSKRSLPRYVDNHDRRRKLNNVMIKKIRLDRIKTNTDEIEYDEEFIKNL